MNKRRKSTEPPSFPCQRIYSVEGRFVSNTRRTYTWACDLYPQPKIGDFVVVETCYGLKVVRVHRVGGTVPFGAYKWVVSKVDLVAHRVRQQVLQRERNRIKIAELKEQIRKLEQEI